MKIGILTYHRAENYGALLQAFALLTYLRGLGNDVQFVDYWPSYHVNFFKIFSWSRFRNTSLKGKIEYLLGATLWLYPKLKRRIKLQGFIHDRLEVSGKPHYNERTTTTEHFDVVVYGSDQIWRKQNMGGVGFDDWYFGAANVQAEKKIVYAGSMGTVKTTTSDDEYVSRMMQNFQAISVREADLQSYLQKLHIPSTLVVDPVFLLSKEQWNQVAAPRNDKEGKYILFYNLLNKVESVHFAERLSKETGLPIKEINKKMSFHHIGKRYISTASVPEFLRLVRDADYVVSNSFHGVAFSLIFQKQFFAVGMGEKANRVISLLSCLGIVQRYIDNQLSFEKIDAIDYEKTTYILSSLFSASQNNLSESLNI